MGHCSLASLQGHFLVSLSIGHFAYALRRVLYKLDRLGDIQLPLTSEVKRELDALTLDQLLAMFAPSTSSSYKGVMQQKGGKPFLVRIMDNGSRINLGSYEDEKEAARAYDRKAFSLWGTYVPLP